MDKVYEFFDYISQNFVESSEVLITEYANSRIASNLTIIMIVFVAIALCVIGFKTARRIREDDRSSLIDYDALATGIFVGVSIVSFMSFVVFIVTVPDLISYIVSPTGTVLREVLSKF